VRTSRSRSTARRRAAIVGALIAVGVLLPVGVGFAAPVETDTATAQDTRERDAAESGPTCDNGRPDVDPSDGVCSRDDDRNVFSTDGAGRDDGGSRDGEDGEDGAESDFGIF